MQVEHVTTISPTVSSTTAVASSPDKVGRDKPVAGLRLASVLGMIVEDAKFSGTGYWYNEPTKFPTALFDANGFFYLADKASLDAILNCGVFKRYAREGDREDTIGTTDQTIGISSLAGYVPSPLVRNAVADIRAGNTVGKQTPFWP